MFTIILSVIGLVALGILVYMWVQEKEPALAYVASALKSGLHKLGACVQSFFQTLLKPKTWFLESEKKAGPKTSAIEVIDDAMPWVTVFFTAVMFGGFAVGAVIVSI